MLCRWWRQLRALHRTSVNDRSFYDAIPLTFKFVLRMSTLSLLKLFVRFKLFTSPASDLHLGTDEKFFDCVCLSCLQDNSADATKKHLFEDSYRSAEWNRMSGELETSLKQWVLEPEKKKTECIRAMGLKTILQLSWWVDALLSTIIQAKRAIFINHWAFTISATWDNYLCFH